MADKARVFIGFDSKEVVAYHVFCQSILEKAPFRSSLFRYR